MTGTKLSDQATLAVLGALLVAVGVFIWFGIGIGLIVGGVECVVGAYVATYLGARK